MDFIEKAKDIRDKGITEKDLRNFKKKSGMVRGL